MSQPTQRLHPEMPERRTDVTPAQRFGARVAAERARRGWSLRELCIKAGMSPNPSVTLRVENGDAGGYGTTLNTAAKVAVALGLSLDGLTGPCAQCADDPYAGFICATCGAEGKEPAS